MADHHHENDLIQTRTEIEAAPYSPEVPTHTSIPMFSELTTSLPVDTQRSSCAYVACHCCKVFLYILLLPIIQVSVLPLFLLILVLLLVSFVALSLVQLIRHGGRCDKATQLKFVVRFWLAGVVIGLLIVVGVTYPVAKHVRILKHVKLIGLPIASWLTLIAIMFALYIFDFCLNVVLHLVPPIPLQHDESGLNFQEAVFEIVDCLLFLLAEFQVVNRVTSFKQHKVLGLHTWKWIGVLIFTAIGCNVLRLCTHFGSWLLRVFICEKLDSATLKNPQHKFLVQKLLPREYLVYYANGLKRGINFILSTLLILLIWLFYFGSHLSKTPQVESILRFGTRTCISVLICSVLWLFKNWAVLSWEAITMYTRLRSQILKSGKQLYFLGILGRHSHDILKLTYYRPVNRRADDIPSMSDPVEWLSSQVLRYIIRWVKSLNMPTTRIKARITVPSGYLFELTALYGSYVMEMELNSRGNTHPFQSILAGLSCILEMTSPDFYNRRIRDREEDDSGQSEEFQHRVKKLSEMKRKIARHDLLMHQRTPTMHDTKQLAQYLISAKGALSDDTFVSSILARLTEHSDIREKLKQLIDGRSNLNDATSENDEFTTLSTSLSPLHTNHNDSAELDGVSDNDWQFFEQEVLQNRDCSECSIRILLEKAQNSCLFLANALSSTKEVVDCLDKIVSCLLIGVTFIIWLLLTGLASTKVLVLIASPLLAATFIFGGSCKTLFQGIMYVYVVHPIHVGDLCSVDDNKMVVKAVGVWTTAFCKVENLGTLEEVTYPNSDLANKVIINHFNEFLWEDSVEFDDLDSLQNPDVKKLKKQIKTYLKLDRDDLVSCSHSVVIEGEDDDFKIIIKLKYKITDIQDWSYFKCIRRKNKIQADVDDLVRQFKQNVELLN